MGLPPIMPFGKNLLGSSSQHPYYIIRMTNIKNYLLFWRKVYKWPLQKNTINNIKIISLTSFSKAVLLLLCYLLLQIAVAV